MSRSSERSLVVLLLFVSVCAACMRGKSDDRPNFVVISVDTLSRSKMRSFNPSADALVALDGFASRGVRLTSAFTTASWTLPAHVSLLTGLYPDQHGVVGPKGKLPDGVATLAGDLAEIGYHTVAFAAGGFVGREHGLERGFRRWQQGVENEAGREGVGRRGGYRFAARELGGAARFIRSSETVQAPFFLFVHTYFVHNYFSRGRSPEQVEGALGCLASPKFPTL